MMKNIVIIGVWYFGKEVAWLIDGINNDPFSADVKIIFMTVAKVLKREGITSETSDTMEEFAGNTFNNM